MPIYYGDFYKNASLTATSPSEADGPIINGIIRNCGQKDRSDYINRFGSIKTPHSVNLGPVTRLILQSIGIDPDMISRIQKNNSKNRISFFPHKDQDNSRRNQLPYITLPSGHPCVTEPHKTLIYFSDDDFKIVITKGVLWYVRTNGVYHRDTFQIESMPASLAEQIAQRIEAAECREEFPRLAEYIDVPAIISMDHRITSVNTGENGTSLGIMLG